MTQEPRRRQAGGVADRSRRLATRRSLIPAAIQDRSYRTRPLRSGASVRAQTEGQALFSAERSLSSISHAWSSVWKAECRMRNGSVHDRMRFATSPAL